MGLGITEPVVKGLCKVIHLTLLRYRDSWSRALVRDLICALATNHADWTIKHLATVLWDIGSTYSSLIPTWVEFAVHIKLIAATLVRVNGKILSLDILMSAGPLNYILPFQNIVDLSISALSHLLTQCSPNSFSRFNVFLHEFLSSISYHLIARSRLNPYYFWICFSYFILHYLFVKVLSCVPGENTELE